MSIVGPGAWNLKTTQIIVVLLLSNSTASNLFYGTVLPSPLEGSEASPTGEESPANESPFKRKSADVLEWTEDGPWGQAHITSNLDHST